MLMPRQVQANRLLLEGATPEQIDRVHVEFGMPMGPFQMADLAGVDMAGTATRAGSRISATPFAQSDRWGQKKGAGFYDYDEKGDPRRLQSSRRSSRISGQGGVEKRDISDQEIIERTLFTMVNEGAKILERAWPSALRISTWFGSTVTAGRSIAAARCSGPIPRARRRSSRG
jgi:3-hydroxyacyl-CoA dehydrogenase